MKTQCTQQPRKSQQTNLMYNIISHLKNQSFIQKNHRFLCRHQRHYAELSQAKGYRVRCRDPRCSKACQSHWAHKQATCLAKHLHDLPEEYKVYRGNLTLHKDATPEDHKRVKEAFLQNLRRWKTKHNYTVEMHATLHPTDQRNAHWDFVLFTDSPAKPFRAALASAWERAGGLRCSRVVMTSEEIGAITRYQTKGFVINREEVHLAPHQSELGLDLTWCTRGFWRGTNLEAIWASLVAEWFPKDTVSGHGPISNTVRDITVNLAPQDDPELPPFYIPGGDITRDIMRFPVELPTDPRRAVQPHGFAEQWGVGTTYLLRVLEQSQKARCINGKWCRSDGMHDESQPETQQVAIEQVAEMNEDEFFGPLLRM
jgi:hypothetical protein